MRTSETTAELYAALAGAQGELSDPGASAENSHFKSKYAKLDAVTSVIRPVFAKHGLLFSQGAAHDEHLGLVMVTRIVHITGQWQETLYPLKKAYDDPQKQASANTYGRRHSLLGAVGIAPSDDDDGEDAQGRGANPEALRAARDEGRKEGHAEGQDAGRTWVIKQLLAPAVAGYSGGQLAADLKAAKVDASVEHVKLWCLLRGKDKPSLMGAEGRAKVIHYLTGNGGRANWDRFVAECGPLPVPKKRTPKAAKWTKAQEAAYLARLAELDWKPEEIEAFQAEHAQSLPQEMTEVGRKAFLEALADTGEGETGPPLGDMVSEWLSTRGSGDGSE